MNTSTIALVELLLKGTAVLLAGYGASLWLARASAAQRSLCWLGVFATMLFLPLALVLRPVWSLPVPIASQPAIPTVDMQPVFAEVPAPGAQAPAAHVSLTAWLAIVYGCGSGAVLAFRLLGAAQLWRLRREAVPHTAGQAIVDGWRAELSLRRAVRVCTSAQVTVPMTCGTWRPVILLPSAPLGAAELEAALQHEFTHVRHGDAARRWLGTMVTALWWPHPLVWAAFRAWKLEQERACDDAVLNSGADAADYAQQLLNAARRARLSRVASAGALVMAMPSGLETRLRSVTNPQVNRASARLRSLLSIGAFALMATLCGIAFQAQSVTAAPPAATPDAAAKALMQKANATIIPQFNAREATLVDLLKEIADASGIKIFYAPKKENEARITIQLTNIPASEALRYVTNLANTTFTYKKDGVYVKDLAPGEVIPPLEGARAPAPPPAILGLAAVNGPAAPVGGVGAGPAAAPLVTREWKIPANFPATRPKSPQPLSARDELTAAGVVFPKGSEAAYSRDHSRLFVKNTQENLDLIDAMVEMSARKTKPAGR